jgi:hypothetical protein
VPNQISVQGILRDASGKLQSMSVTTTVRLFDAQMGGTALGTPIQGVAVGAQNGLFTLAVTIDDTLKAKLFTATQVWLELQADADTFPRQLVTAEAFALMCGSADSLSVACVGCVTDAMLGSGIDSSKLIGSGFIAQDDQVAANVTSTNTSFEDIAGFPGWTTSVPLTKTYLLTVDVGLYAGTAAGGVDFRVTVDGVAPPNQPVNAQHYFFNTINDHRRLAFRMPVTLVAGQHTFRLQWKVSAAGPTLVIDLNDSRCFTLTG